MTQTRRWDDCTQDQTKVVQEVDCAGLMDELVRTDGVLAILVNPRVQAGVVDVPDFLAVANIVEEVRSICATTQKGLARLNGSMRSSVWTNSNTDGDHMVTQGFKAFGGAPWWRGGRRP